ncbi:MAG: PKD domain-containing protein, partial [Bacteroidota bacterium]
MSHQAKNTGDWRIAYRQCLLILFVLVFPAFSCVFGQSDKWVKKGDIAFAEQDYTKAIDYYAWAAKGKSPRAGLEGLGRCYRATFDYVQAEATYARLCTLSNPAPIHHFYHGQALLANAKAGAARDAFDRYLTAAGNNPDFPTPVLRPDEVDRLYRDSIHFELQKMPFNGNSADFSPMYYGDGLIFCSSRRAETGIVHTSTVNNAPLVNLYYTESDTAGQWSRPKIQSALTSKFNEGPIWMDSVSNTLFLTRNDPSVKMRGRANRGLNRLKIYASPQQETPEFQALPFCSSDYAVGHPTMTADGKMLYFAADMPGGQGGTDLWKAEWNGTQWSAPRNLGPEVNTPGDELFPYVHADGTLFFASNGHLGLGGLDLFQVRPLGDEAWSRIANLGYPINSPQDDFGIIWDRRKKTGFFSSNRGGDLKNDNIYHFQRFRPDFECVPQKENNYCFRFFESGNSDLDADTLPLIYEWDFGDGTKGYGLETRHCFPGPGDYLVMLNLIDTTSDFVFLNESTYELNLKDHEQVFIAGPDTVVVGQEVRLDGYESTPMGCEIGQYFWEFGDG